jgi:argininosuccinate lyase
VAEAQKSGRPLKQIAAERLATLAPAVAARLDSVFDPVEAVKSKSLRGGTAPVAVRASLDAALARAIA